MGEQTNISWCDHTFNPVIGCCKISAGCANCYALTLMETRYKRAQWGPNTRRVRTSSSNWKKPLQWNASAKATGKRAKVFCASLSDVFEDHPDWVQPRADLFDLIAQTPYLDWLLLTKRIEGWEDRLHEVVREASDGGDMLASQWLDGDAPDNIWLGTSVENQAAADKRIPELITIPAQVHFLSCEPLLGPVDINEYWPDIEWVIVGGESGHNARPMHPKWVSNLADHCQERGVKFFFKQWGEFVGGHGSKESYVYLENGESLCGDKNTYEWGDGYVSHRVGKKRAGALLFETAYKEFPK